MADSLTFDANGAIVRITLNRPSAGNVIDVEMLGELAAAWRQFQRDPDLKVAILTGAGNDFCLGEDVADSGSSAFPATHEVMKPIVLAVNGNCRGAGLRFVGQCDIVIAAEGAEFAGASLSGGLPYEDFLYQRRRLPAPIGELLILSGGQWTIDAQRGYDLGWISEVTPANQLQARADTIAQAVARNHPTILQVTKEIIVRGRDAFTRDAVEQGRAIVVPLEKNRVARETILARQS